MIKKLWEAWNLRGLILISLSLQAFLILFASCRKRSGSIWVITPIWSAYLLADWVAAVAVGLISKGGVHDTSLLHNGDLLALWASFLLVHLGGPDTITSFSLEDNELWIRHFLGLVLQVGAAAYVFLESLHNNKLWISTILVLLAGTIKYAERTRALYLASLDHFGDSACRKPNPGPEYERVQQMYNSLRFAHLPARVQTTVKEPDELGLGPTKYRALDDLTKLDPMSLFRHALGFFETFKGLVAGLYLSSQDCQVSRDFFLSRKAEDAFKLIEVELSLMYEVLHTKVVVVRSWAGFVVRFISSSSVLVAFLVFCSVDKKGFRKLDERLTYALFIGALILDVISVFKILFFDRTVAALESRWGEFIASIIINKSRWSESVCRCNFMSYTLRDFPKWINNLGKLICAGNILDKLKIWLLVSHEHVDEKLRYFVFTELRIKSLFAVDTTKIGEICSSRGGRALELGYSGDQLEWSVKVEYAESLLLWHIATELCYSASSFPDDNRELSKLLSDYTFYLLLMQPSIMAPVLGNWQMVFRDTCADAKRFFRKHSCSKQSEACQMILSVKADIKPGAVKGDLCKSVLFDACILADQLLKLGERRWELMAKVWLEMLCYAAIHSRANVHAQQPSKGGQLITLIWLLMNHFGLGNQFYEANVARIKFIVRK